MEPVKCETCLSKIAETNIQFNEFPNLVLICSTCNKKETNDLFPLNCEECNKIIGQCNMPLSIISNPILVCTQCLIDSIPKFCLLCKRKDCEHYHRCKLCNNPYSPDWFSRHFRLNHIKEYTLSFGRIRKDIGISPIQAYKFTNVTHYFMKEEFVQ